MSHLAVSAVEHSCRNAVPDIGERIITDGQAEPVELLIEGIQSVIEGPQGFAALSSRKHVLGTALGNGIRQCRIDCHQFRGRFDIQVVHRHGSNYALGIVGDGLAKMTQVDEDAHTIVIE